MADFGVKTDVFEYYWKLLFQPDQKKMALKNMSQVLPQLRLIFNLVCHSLMNIKTVPDYRRTALIVKDKVSLDITKYLQAFMVYHCFSINS